MRKCLKCDKDFDSKGSYNRICPTCSEVNAKVRDSRRSASTKDTGSGFRRGVSVGSRHS